MKLNWKNLLIVHRHLALVHLLRQEERIRCQINRVSNILSVKNFAIESLIGQNVRIAKGESACLDDGNGCCSRR